MSNKAGTLCMHLTVYFLFYSLVMFLAVYGVLGEVLVFTACARCCKRLPVIFLQLTRPCFTLRRRR